MFTILLGAHVVLALCLIGIILLQQGKGATAGAAFGSGASSTVFGARGSGSFLTRTTAILAILFFSNSLLLAYLYGQAVEPRSLFDELESQTGTIVEEQLPAEMPSPPATGDVPDVPVPE